MSKNLFRTKTISKLPQQFHDYTKIKCYSNSVLLQREQKTNVQIFYFASGERNFPVKVSNITVSPYESHIALSGNKIIFIENCKPYPNRLLIGYISQNNNVRSLNIIDPSLPSDFASITTPILMEGTKNEKILLLYFEQNSGVLIIVTNIGMAYVYSLNPCVMFYSERIFDYDLVCSISDPINNYILTFSENYAVDSILIDNEKLEEIFSNFMLEKVQVKNINFEFKYFESYQMEQFENVSSLEVVVKGVNVKGGESKGEVKVVKESKSKISKDDIKEKKIIEKEKYQSISNMDETIKFVQNKIKDGKKNVIQKMLELNKLYLSPELGELLINIYPDLSLLVYIQLKDHSKVLDLGIQLKSFKKILEYLKDTNHHPNYSKIFDKLVGKSNRDLVQFMKLILASKSKLSLDINQIFDYLENKKLFRECTEIFLDHLKQDLTIEGDLQTRLITMNLKGVTQVGIAIIENGIFTKYDKETISNVCYEAGCYQEALKLTGELNKMKKILGYSEWINQEFLLEWFGSLTLEDFQKIFRVLLKEKEKNGKLILAILQKYSDIIKEEDAVSLLIESQSYTLFMLYLQNVNKKYLKDNSIIKEILELIKNKDYEKLIKIITISKEYDPQLLKTILMNCKIKNHIPFYKLCVRFGYTEEITKYCYDSSLVGLLNEYYQINDNEGKGGYNQEKNQIQKLIRIIEILFKNIVDSVFIEELLSSIGFIDDLELVINLFEKESKLNYLQNYVEKIAKQGNKSKLVHTTLAKIYLLTNNNINDFLKSNHYYDRESIKEFIEKHNLNYLIEKEEFKVSNEEKKEIEKEFSQLRKDNDIQKWENFLNNQDLENLFITNLIKEAIVSIENTDIIHLIIKSYMVKNAPNQMLIVLEHLVLNNKFVSSYESLHNLLILTAIKCKSSKILEYIKWTELCNWSDLANVALGYNLNEIAFQLYHKGSKYVKASDILLNYHKDIHRTINYVQDHNVTEFWVKIGKKQLQKGEIKSAVESFLNGQDYNQFESFLNINYQNTKKDAISMLITYFEFCKSKIKNDPKIDNHLVYLYAQNNDIQKIKDFLSKNVIQNKESLILKLKNEQLNDVIQFLK
ncbi:clathrin heavy chain [Anaeramoeba flamelloides]|uniref:Clathrin heavy chain n=1 Tax=Anaeramoeba flamelloides TaxID=1746091 RepID=A0AAV7YXU5_9EUKA|nr:clathrin heavy chain [Anaeramoeba flamelloides]